MESCAQGSGGWVGLEESLLSRVGGKMKTRGGAAVCWQPGDEEIIIICVPFLLCLNLLEPQYCIHEPPALYITFFRMCDRKDKEGRVITHMYLLALLAEITSSPVPLGTCPISGHLCNYMDFHIAKDLCFGTNGLLFAESIGLTLPMIPLSHFPRAVGTLGMLGSGPL